MVLPKIILKTDLETYLGCKPERLRDLTEGRLYVPKEYRTYVNTVLHKEFGKELPNQMKIDAYAELHLQHGCEPLTNLVFGASKASVPS